MIKKIIAITNSNPGIWYGRNWFGLNCVGRSPAINSTINIVKYIVAPIGAATKAPVKKYLWIFFMKLGLLISGII